jgi:hypothetical protein
MGTYTGKHNRCNNCCNLFVYKDKNEKYCYKCILDTCENCNRLEEEIKNYKDLYKEKSTDDIYEFIHKLKIKRINLKHNKINDEINNLFKEKEINYKDKPDIENICIKYEYKKNNKIDFKPIKKDINDLKLKITKLREEFKLLEISSKKIEKDEKIIKEHYENLMKNPNTIKLFNSNNIKLKNLFNKYKETKINEYNLILKIGELLQNNEFNKEEKKELSNLTFAKRSSRYINLYKRVYLLSKYVNIENISFSGISNFLRDSSEDNFNILFNLIKLNYV